MFWRAVELHNRLDLLRPGSERANEVLSMLKEENYDVVALQEVFDESAADVLAQGLTQAGYHTISHICSQQFGVNSGLFLAVKGVPQKIEFYEHPLKVGSDKLARKGVLITHIEMEKGTCVIANTHLNGGGSEGPVKSYTARAAQMLAVTHHINRYVSTLKKKVKGVFLCGDTNNGPTEDWRRNPETREFEPVMNREWFLADQLYVVKELLVIPQNPMSKKGWDRFCDQVTWYFDGIQPKKEEEAAGNIERVREHLEGRVHLGGSFPTQCFKHCFAEGTTTEQAMEGTTVDMEKMRPKPQCVDFVFQLKTGEDFYTSSTTAILPSVNEKKEPLSDHYAVRSVFRW